MCVAVRLLVWQCKHECPPFRYPCCKSADVVLPIEVYEPRTARAFEWASS